MKLLSKYVGMLALALLLVGGGCASQGDVSDSAMEAGHDLDSAMEGVEEVVDENVEGGGEVVGEVSVELTSETFTHESGAYTYTFDPAKYATQIYVSSDSVSLDDISGEFSKTALQVFVKSADDSKLAPEVLENATSQTPTFAKKFGTQSIYGALASDGQILEVRCQAKSCDDLLPMLSVN